MLKVWLACVWAEHHDGLYGCIHTGTHRGLLPCCTVRSQPLTQSVTGAQLYTQPLGVGGLGIGCVQVLAMEVS
jgi:hypothetical protein